LPHLESGVFFQHDLRHSADYYNPALKRDCAKIARVFPDIIGAKAPNAGVKARSLLAPLR